MTDQKGVETVRFYFGPTPRLSVLYFTVTHTYEHYGNMTLLQSAGLQDRRGRFRERATR